MMTIIIRALRTYAQALLGFLLASNLMDLDIESLKILAIAALPAALSALQNALEEKGLDLGPRG